MASWCVNPSHTELHQPPVAEYISAPIEPVSVEWSTTTVKELAIKVATENELPVKWFTDTIACESGFEAKAYNASEDSAGPVQVHLPAHPDITLKMAEDPSWAIPWMASEWKAGHESLWTCSQIVKNQQAIEVKREPSPPTLSQEQ